MAKSIVLTMLIAHLCAGCGGGRSEGDGGIGTGVQPRQFPPSTPGYIDVGPGGLQLVVGHSALLTAALYDSYGTPQTLPTLSWSTQSSSVQVDSGGVVTAMAEGLGAVSVTDNQHGIANLPIMVVKTAPAAGPAGITFTPPNVVLPVGATAQLNYRVTDASGTVVMTPADLRFVTSRGGVVNVDAAGLVTGLSAGVVLVGAVVGGSSPPSGGVDGGSAGTALAGNAIIVVQKASPPAGGTGGSSGNGGGISCNPPLEVFSCQLIVASYLFPKPGIGDTLRAMVVREQPYSCSTNGAPQVQFTQEAPSLVDIKDTAVATIAATGDLTAVAPGGTEATASLEGVICNSFNVSVYPDLNGSWTGTCGGNAADVEITSWPDTVMYTAFYIGGQPTGLGPSGSGTSCFSTPACSGFIHAGGTETGFAPTQGPCSDSNVCYGVGVGDECAELGMTGIVSTSKVLGPDHLAGGNCDLTRGTGGMCGSAPVDMGNMCNDVYSGGCKCSPSGVPYQYTIADPTNPNGHWCCDYFNTPDPCANNQTKPSPYACFYEISMGAQCCLLSPLPDWSKTTNATQCTSLGTDPSINLEIDVCCSNNP